MSSASFLNIGLFECSLMLSYMSYLSISDTNPLSYIWFASIFSDSRGSLFAVYSSFAVPIHLFSKLG